MRKTVIVKGRAGQMWLLRESDIWADISEGGEVVKQVKL